ncbi:hypothetical protein ASPACDRAFT_118139 [Aspergillus aculeatus ATCC 16872]|uniref:DUF1772-domain-containing protein n=1 Tax=Aspergillus aculeatus (strain ATCC 16872 / CBS 172.66 / WB 5094) TaxID=690307 RepID=A0A1L9WV98_ASPA1|nr:uncharacterized protein ASPACDRAFT_118139 [Aspergillus aculeatus ATCC 16872]OJK00162.1 hypothetical protein ASPACDRAFT_118139 [Aspergillus aculeatus ATCC 16872]
MTTNPLAYRTAQAIGFTGAAWLSGTIASQSLITIPALLSPDPDPDPTHQIPRTSPTALKIWKRISTASTTQNAPVAAGTAAAFVYLAWTVARAVEPPQLLQFLSSSSSSSYASPGRWYAAAAVLTVGVVPFTGVVMRGTDCELMRLVGEGEGTAAAEEKAEEEAERTSGLLKRWAVLNAVRSLLPLVGGLCGFAAAVI